MAAYCVKNRKKVDNSVPFQAMYSVAWVCEIRCCFIVVAELKYFYVAAQKILKTDVVRGKCAKGKHAEPSSIC